MFYQHTVADGVQCVIGNAILQKYSSYIYGILCVGVCPVVITTVFGLLAFRNVRQIAHRTVPLVRRELDKQLTVMILVQGFFNVWILLPYIVTNSLPLDPVFISDPFLFPRWYFVNSLTLLIYYLYFAVSKSCVFCPKIRHLCSFRYPSTSTFVFPNAFVNSSSMSWADREFCSIDQELRITIKSSHKLNRSFQLFLNWKYQISRMHSLSRRRSFLKMLHWRVRRSSRAMSTKRFSVDTNPQRRMVWLRIIQA